MSETTPNPVLTERYRNNTLESFHRGAVCILNTDNEIIFSTGNPNQVVFPRSALKFIQQIPLIEEKVHQSLGLSEEEAAITCGSHNGEEFHCEKVRSILGKAGLNEELLQCGAQPPTLKEDRNELYRTGKKPLPVHNNCSGKHAGFLALSSHLGHSVENYIDKEHPVQQRIRSVVADMHEFPENKMDTGLDGCSAPIFSMPLFNMTLGFKNLLFPESNQNPARKAACEYLSKIIPANPYLIAGKNRYCTDLMQAAKGRIIAKTGADGIFILACPEQKWVAGVKIDDGTMGPQYAVAQEIVNKTGILSKDAMNALDDYRKKDIKTWSGKISGQNLVRSSALENIQF